MVNTDQVQCSPLLDIRRSQSLGPETWPREQLYPNESPPSINNSDPGFKIAQLSGGENFQNLPARMKPTASSLNAQDPRRRAYGMQQHPPAIIPGETQAVLRSNDSNRPWETWETSEGDMDISPDNSGGGGHDSTSTSDHTTPNSSHNASSSHTAYTPPNLDDSQTYPPTQNRGDLNSSTDINNNTSSFFPVPDYQDLANTNMFPPTPGKDENAFAMPPGWDLGLGGGGTGLTPEASGMTPVSGQAWSEMLENMGWDANSIGDGRRSDGRY